MNDPMRAILIATNRSGSTFLNHALDSHLDIGWERGEPLTPRRGEPDPVVCVDDVLREKRGYQVVGCKLSYRYLQKVLGVEALRTLGVTRIIHLHRENTVRTILSSTINIMARDGVVQRPYQTDHPLAPVRITVDVDQFVAECYRYVRNVNHMIQTLSALNIDTHFVTYAEMVGGEGSEAGQVAEPVARDLCAFLGIEYQPLRARLRRVNPQPIQSIVENWDALWQRLLDTPFSRECDHATA